MKVLRAAALAAIVLIPCLGSSAELTNDSLATIRRNIAEDKAVLVDVREKSEWDRGHVKGAVFAPLSALQKDAAIFAKRLPKDKIIYTHCVVGVRSVTAGHILEQMGYEVRPIKPGYKDMVNAGFPSER